jgi:hypothetical protein
VLLALLSAIAPQVAISKSYTLVPRWPLLVLEAMLLLALLAINPRVMSRRTRFGRYRQHLVCHRAGHAHSQR